jgi:N-acetylglucosaminyldiphosphoundecaprenol N-acetyl-beta-D-mannosaminyltransferase
MSVPNRLHILGLPVDVLDRRGMLEQVRKMVAAGAPKTLAYLNVHVVNSARDDAVLKGFLQGVDLCYADGQGIVLGARLQGKHLPERMTGADWIWDLAKLAESQGWTLAWVGGEPGVSQAAAETLREKHPKLKLHSEHGFYSPEQTPALLARINAAEPDIVLVGMGTPTQEHWTAEHRSALSAPVVWCLGATADFVSGKTDRGPGFLNQNAEWLARLITEPERLWKRYLLGNPLFIARVIKERVLSPTR